MKTGELFIKSDDKTNLYLKWWEPNESPRGVIIMVHGLGEHINRYRSWAERYIELGWAFIGHDLRGHGNTQGIRGNGNYLSHLNDIDAVFGYTVKKYGNIPKILYGHSMGGNLALGYEIYRKPAIDSLIVTSPWLKLPKPPIVPVVLLAKLAVKLFPALAFPNGINLKMLSRDPKIAHEVIHDPLCHNRISVSTFLQMQQWAASILKNKHKINVPLLLLHGNKDKVTSWKGSYMLSQATSENTCFEIWNGAFHELHNDICKDEVFVFITEWLDIASQKIRKFNVS
jgi:acylglycerol lipase